MKFGHKFWKSCLYHPLPLPRATGPRFPPTLGCLGFTAPRKRSAEAETTPPKTEWNDSETINSSNCFVNSTSQTSELWIYCERKHWGWAHQRLGTLGSRSWQGTELMLQHVFSSSTHHANHVNEQMPTMRIMWTMFTRCSHDVHTMFTRCSLSSLLRMPMCAHSWRHWVQAWILSPLPWVWRGSQRP